MNIDKAVHDIRAIQKKYSTDYFYFCTNEINNDLVNIDNLCQALAREKINIHWTSFADVSNMSGHLLETLRHSGCYQLCWGIESGSDRILKKMGKKYSVEQAEKTLKMSAALGIRNRVNIMTGFPQEEEPDYLNTLAFIKRNIGIIEAVGLFDFYLVEDSPVARNPEKYGIENMRKDSINPYGLGPLIYDQIGGMKWDDLFKKKTKYFKMMQEEINSMMKKKQNASTR